jgi:prepilin-type N-terminal cleavage/methylation domain-containing protein
MINKIIFKKNNVFNNKKGFTLIELMLVVAIIGILAGIIMVSLSGQRQRAQDTKILAELSATIQPMLMCLSDDKDVTVPNNGGNICLALPAYGLWPNYGADYTFMPSTLDSFNNTPPALDWFFYVEGELKIICCNEISKKCSKIPKTDTCTALTQL